MTTGLVARVILAVATHVGRVRSLVLRYTSALLVTLCSASLQLVFFPEPGIAPFVFFYPGVALSAGLGGRGPGLLCIAISALVANRRFIRPYTGWSTSQDALIATALFVTGGALVALICASFRTALLRMEAASRELEQSDRALRESEERLRAIFDRAALGIAELDGSDRFLAVNDRLCEILGYRREEMLSRGINDVTVPKDRHVALEKFQALRQGRVETCEYEKRCFRSDGTALWVHVTVSAIRDGAGTYRGAVGTIGDIGSRRAAEAQRDRLLAELREADRRKNEFLGMLSHELRNPLAPIRNSLYILGRAAPGGEQARRALAVIDRQVQHTTRLVDDLLDVTRIARGKIRLQRERVDLCALARRTVEDHREVFARNGVDLELVLPDEELVVDADATRLGQVIGNLLNNAVKFTPRGGTTRLTLDRTDGFAELAVRDTGAGIASDVIPQLFEPFMQVENTLDRSAGGLGLGLALVKGLVELHGGSVRVQSEGIGRGTSFVVRLPLERRQPRHLTVVPARSAARANRRVLVIEDNIDAAESMKEALELSGHLVDIALTGPDGVEKAHAETPDVIVCDIGLPGMDGFHVAKAIRASPRLDHVPLIALSGYAQPDDIERSKEAGFDLHLAKPPDLDALERAIVELCATADSASISG
ncbi:MAG TPA: ATP-binding protein [Anaeromyxobacteraceae bacterium]|nr:ATP-binding protein [Anaeromyxobacteraceae bacterium]